MLPRRPSSIAAMRATRSAPIGRRRGTRGGTSGGGGGSHPRRRRRLLAVLAAAAAILAVLLAGLVLGARMALNDPSAPSSPGALEAEREIARLVAESARAEAALLGKRARGLGREVAGAAGRLRGAGAGAGAGAGDDFERVLWPQLHQMLCPAGTPEIALGEVLFDLARNEYGDADQIGAHDPSFFDSFFGPHTLVKDGNHPNESLMYVNIWKCGNNQIRSYLESNFNQNPTPLERKPEFSRSRWDGQVLSASNASYTTYMKFKIIDEGGSGYEIPSGDEPPCVFTVIRDPISHFLSGYNELETRITLERKRTGMLYRHIPFSHIPGHKGRYGFDDKTLRHLQTIRFETFVRNLAQGHPSQFFWLSKHVYPMSRILHKLKREGLLPTTGDWILPSTANLTESLPRFLAKRCPRFVENYPWAETVIPTDSGLPPMETDGGQHQSSSDPLGTYKAAKDVWKKGGPTARAMCHLKAFDYACFYGDAAPAALTARDIPTTCKEVYASDLFSKATRARMAQVEQAKALLDGSLPAKETWAPGSKSN